MKKYNKLLFLLLLVVYSIIGVNSSSKAATEVIWKGCSFSILDTYCWDSGGHIDWEYLSDTYANNIVDAQNMWNKAIKKGNGYITLLRKYKSENYRDVTIEDYLKKDGRNAYIHTTNSHYGDMHLNLYYLGSMKKATITAVIAHEFGHAFGIADILDGKAIMYYQTPKVTNLGKTDKAAVDYVVRKHTDHLD